MFGEFAGCTSIREKPQRPAMNLKNYTTEIDAARTLAEIESLLIDFGAVGTHREYEDRRVKSIVFELKVEWGRMPVQIPVDVDAAFRVLKSQKKNFDTARHAPALKAQAERVAWRIWLDWLRVQLSLIQMQKVEAAQIFMPYIPSGEGRSVFSIYRETQMKQLAAHKEPPEGESQ